MKQTRVYYIEVTFGKTVRENCVCGKDDLMKFLHHMDMMMKEGDTISVYYLDQVVRLDGHTNLQRVVIFDGDNDDLECMMKSY
jgi:hypothetical protein